MNVARSHSLVFLREANRASTGGGHMVYGVVRPGLPEQSWRRRRAVMPRQRHAARRWHSG